MNLSLRRTKPLGALGGLALPRCQGGHPALVSPHHTSGASLSPSPHPACGHQGWSALPNGPFWVEKPRVWHRALALAAVRPVQLCPRQGFCCVTASPAKNAGPRLLPPHAHQQKLWELLFQRGRS